MRLTLCDHTATSSHESDYDTAVDLVHYSELRVCYVLGLPSGLRLVVEQTHIATSRSYLEPDFDLLEAGGELVYQQHASEEPGSEAVYHRVELDPLFRQRALTRQEWAQVLSRDPAEDFDVTMFQHADEELCAAELPPIAWPALFDAVDALAMLKGQQFDSELLGAAFSTWAAQLDAQAWALNAHNLHARIESRGALALHRLQVWLDGQPSRPGQSTSFRQPALQA